MNIEKGIRPILNKLNLPKNISVLDIGCFGLNGVNTSNILVDEFYEHGSIEGICYTDNVPQKYNNIHLYKGDYFETCPSKTYDLICCDLGALGQIKLIENDINTKLYNLLNTNGILIFYLFRTNSYSPYELQIKNHILSYWVQDISELSIQKGQYAISEHNIQKLITSKYSQEYDLINIYEESRDYITWVTLKKK